MWEAAKERFLRLIEVLFEKYLKKKSLSLTHPNGTYISAILSEPNCEDIYNWAKAHKIPNLADPQQYHATLIYSRKGIPDVKAYDFELPLSGKVCGWHVFPTQTGGKCLVAALESKQLTNIHKDIMDKYGATYDFDEYKPHVTISYDYDKDEAPKTFPRMRLFFNKVKIDPLDPEFTPKKAK